MACINGININKLQLAINRNLLKVCVSFSCHILWLTSSTWLKANS